MKICGRFFHGLGRGCQLIELDRERLKGMISYEPFCGTFNIKLDTPLPTKNITDVKMKRLMHTMRDGKQVVEAFIIPAKIKIKDSVEDCWIFRQENGPYEDDVLEIIHKECLEKKYNVKEGDEIEVII